MLPDPLTDVPGGALADWLADGINTECRDGSLVLTPSKLRLRVAAIVAAIGPRDVDEQHEDACAARSVKKYPREHGMTGIWALLPADLVAAVWAAINTHAEAIREPGDHRTADQRRADSLAEVMTAYLDGTCPTQIPGSASGPADAGQPCARGHRPPTVPAWCHVQIKIFADWLLGQSIVEQPGDVQPSDSAGAREAPILTGHGPLPTDVALRLIADAGWQRIVYDPLTGALLDVGSTVHDQPPPLRRHVLVRDGGCTQPICGNPRVDIDHNIPPPTGPTSAVNLRSRCRHDHRLKQHPEWNVQAGPAGRIEWITPTGHAYLEHVADLRPGQSSLARSGHEPVASAEQSEDRDGPPPY